MKHLYHAILSVVMLLLTLQASAYKQQSIDITVNLPIVVTFPPILSADSIFFLCGKLYARWKESILTLRPT